MSQHFKSVYFSDYPSDKTKNKSLTIAFNDNESCLYNTIRNLSNYEIREIIGVSSYKQLELFAEKEDRNINQLIKVLLKSNISVTNSYNSKDVTFVNSKSIPFNRWYPYIEGYSPDFVSNLIRDYCPKAKRVYDPFVGTGTTIFAADELGVQTLFSEVNPLLQFLIDEKIRILSMNHDSRRQLSKQLHNIAENIEREIEKKSEDVELRNNYYLAFKESKYFNDDTFNKILKLSTFINEMKLENQLLANAITIATLASLVPISYLKKAGDVRFKNEKELAMEKVKIESALPEKIREIANDILNMNYELKTEPGFLISNAKDIDLAYCEPFDAVITSPPYLNGTNYFRNTKLELWFLKFIKNEKDLRLLRNQALTSGINDVKKKNTIDSNIFDLANMHLLRNTLKELDQKTYDKRIPVMIRDYFMEMYSIFDKLKRHLKKDSVLLIDIGDSVFADVHIRTDDIFVEVLNTLGYKLDKKMILRKRRSRDKSILNQVLLVLRPDAKHNKISLDSCRSKPLWYNNWELFKKTLPHQQYPYQKRNWGHQNHSLCSYQGKLKASLAYNLVKTFVPENGVLLDPFSGVGTIPFEAALNSRRSFGIDISLPAYYISYAKVSHLVRNECYRYVDSLSEYIKNNKCTKAELENADIFGFNKSISAYFEETTLKEVLLARRFVAMNKPKTPNEMMVVSSLLHILHGNRPYALSRKSHPIVPYAPQGEFVYKDLILNLKEKVDRTLDEDLPPCFVSGKIFNQDVTNIWPQEINDLDAIITSPPFFDSTRFYLANWMRIWFAGWSDYDFKNRSNAFIEEKQKKSFDVYKNIFRQGRERLKKQGVFVMHLGKSTKCDMAQELEKVSKRWFRKVDLFSENVEHCESHGIRDKGTVTTHQYLILQ